MIDPADIKIINRVKGGDTNSYGRLIEKYQEPLFVMIVNMIRSPETAEDIAQDVFFAAYRHLKTFDPAKARFSTWLFQIARNRCRNELKRRKEKGMPDMEKHPSGHDPAADLMKKEMFKALDRALHELPFRQKVVFVLSEIQGLSLAEISRIEKRPVGTIKSRLFRAKKKLRSQLNAYTRKK